MKKIMLAISIVAALAVFISMIVVSPSFAAEATKTPPTIKKQAPAPTPKVQQQKVAILGPKAQFWDLEIDYVHVDFTAGKADIPLCAPYNGPYAAQYYVIGGRPTHLIFHYKVKTPPIKDITEADVAKWGSGNMTYALRMNIYANGAPSNTSVVKIATGLKLPKLNWEELKKKGGNTPMIWSKTFAYTWHPCAPYNQNSKGADHGQCTVLNFNLDFRVDSNNEIAETDENNNYCPPDKFTVLKGSCAMYESYQ